MRRLMTFLSGVVAGGMLTYLAMNVHVIRAEDGFHVVSKIEARLAETYVDIRSFGVADWAGRTRLAAAIANSNKRELLDQSVPNTLSDGFGQLLEHSAW